MQGTAQPYQHSGASFTFAENEAGVHALLRSFAERLRLGTGGGAHPAQRTVATAQPGTFFDLTCKVPSGAAA